MSRLMEKDCRNLATYLGPTSLVLETSRVFLRLSLGTNRQLTLPPIPVANRFIRFSRCTFKKLPTRLYN